MGNCCNDHHRHHIDKYVNLSKLKPEPWDEVPLIVGMTECGKVVVVDKPLHELTEEDREKLNSIIIDGDGTLFLADDGTYKSLNLENIPNIVLDYYESSANFVIGNLSKLQEIRSLLDEGQETFVRMDFGNFVLPVHVAYCETQLIFEFDQVVLSTPMGREISKTDNPYLRFKLIIVLNTTSEIPTVIHYQVRTGVDSDDVLVVNGEGESALYNDGLYKPTYTKEQIDALVLSTLADYYTKEQIDAMLANYYTKEEVDTIISDNNENYYTKDEIDTTFDNYYTKEESDTNLADAIQDAVFYDDNDDIRPRKDIYLSNDNQLFGIATNKGIHNIATLTEENKVQIGSDALPLQIDSNKRPSVNGTESVAYISDMDNFQNQLDQTNADLQDHVEEYNTFSNATNEAIGKLDERVTVNESDIENLRDDLAKRELFRGYYLTTNEVTAIKNPVQGNYAWNAETGTVWYYNGLTWADTGDRIPDQTVEASDSNPLMDDVAEPGSSNQYARGDHRHPTDTTRAAVSDLENYYKKTDADELLAETVKDAVFYDENDNIQPRKDINLANNNSLVGTSTISGIHHVAGITADDKVQLGAERLPLNIDAKARPTVNSTESIAYVSDVEDLQANFQNHVDEHDNFHDGVSETLEEVEKAITGLEGRVTTNEGDIDALRDDLAQRELFRGYFRTTNEVTAIENPVLGNYAWNAETGTVWYYNGTTWADTEKVIPDQTVEVYDGTPLQDGRPSAGSTNQYARGDHRHPTDTTRAAVSDLENYYTKEEMEEYFGNNNGNYYTKEETDATLENYYKKEEADENLAEAVKEAVFYDEYNTIRPRKDISLANANNLVGLSSNNGSHQIAGITAEDVVKLGSATLPLNMDSKERLTVNSTESVAYLSDVAQAQSLLQSEIDDIRSGLNVDIDGLKTELQEQIDETNTNLQAHVDEYNAFNNTVIETFEAVDEAVSGLDQRITSNKSATESNRTEIETVGEELQGHIDEYNTFSNAVTVNFDTVNGAISELDGRVTGNTSEINSLRDDLAERELFRGYFLTTNEITAIELPKLGNYAWNAETGTVWYYNGTTWADTNKIIPDQTVEVYEGTPLPDGDASPGHTNQYARGDHRHPTDTTRAAVSDLENYYTKEEMEEYFGDNNGNYYTREETDEAFENYYKKEEADENLSEAVKDAVFYDEDDTIRPRKNIRLANSNSLSGMASNSGIHHVAGITAEDVVKLGSATLPLNMDSKERLTVNSTESVAYLSDVEQTRGALQTEISGVQSGLNSDIEDLKSEVQSHVDEFNAFNTTVNETFEAVDEVISGLDQRITSNKSAIDANRADIDSLGEELQGHIEDYNTFNSAVTTNFGTVNEAISELDGRVTGNTSVIDTLLDDLAERELFRGYFLTTDEVTAIELPKPGNYAWNAETGTVWYYNGTTWANTGNIIPDQTVEPYEGTPLADSENGRTGSSNQYARGDHRHPTDTTRAAVTDLENYLPLAGNTQLSPMGGSVWLGTGNAIYVTSSGNSYLQQDTNTQTTVLKGNGAGGIDLTSDLGTIKANGQQILVNGVNDPAIQVTAPEIEIHSNDTLSMSAGSVQLSADTFTGTFQEEVNIESITGDITIKPAMGNLYYGDSSFPLNEVATLGDIESADYLPVAGGTIEGSLNIEGEAYYNSVEVATVENVSDLKNHVAETYVLKSGDTITGDLTVESGNITVDSDKSVRFSGRGAVRIEHSEENSQLKIIATTTENGVDVATNPSVPSSKFTYNGVEVATIGELYRVKPFNFETEIEDTNLVLLPHIPESVIALYFERVVLYENEYTITGSALTFTSDDIDISGVNKVKIVYTIKD